MTELAINACAKINLTLEVVRRLPNGYHELRTVFQQVDLCDELTVSDSAGSDIELVCAGDAIPASPANLVWRAAELVRSRCCPQRGVRIHLRKQIPIGGGLGGGSADAAATLVGLNRLWRLGLAQDELLRMGAGLGKDVPFCILGGTALGIGCGDEVSALPALPRTHCVIAHPGASISTASAYAALRPEHMGGGARTAAMIDALARGDARAVAAGLYNVFEQNACALLPQTERIKTIMLQNGAWNAALSGSGSCVFGLAGSLRTARKIAAALRGEFPFAVVTQTR